VKGVGGARPYTKLSQVQSPAQTFVFVEDCDSRGMNVGTWVVQWSTAPRGDHQNSFTWVDPLPMYHGNVSTFGFLDGHAEHHRWLNSTLRSYGKAVALGGGGVGSPPRGYADLRAGLRVHLQRLQVLELDTINDFGSL
jgi:prepilin-type processing-associated H-X9-DG protein